MIKYDSALIYKYAERLYDQARGIIIVATIIGAAFSYIVGVALSNRNGDNAGLSFVLVLLFGGIGYLLGAQRAFALKLQAQIALCQVRIEENTRVG